MTMQSGEKRCTEEEQASQTSQERVSTHRLFPSAGVPRRRGLRCTVAVALAEQIL